MFKQAANATLPPKHGVRAAVDPADRYLARLMFYLRLVTACLETNPLDDYITDFRQPATLSATQRRNVLTTAEKLSPEELIGKIIVQAAVGRSSSKEVYPRHIDPLPGEMVVLGRQVAVRKALLCTPRWVETFYKEPIERLPEIVFRTKHCAHCRGTANTCACARCPRFSWSQCEPKASSIPLQTAHTSATRLESPTRPLSPAQLPMSGAIGEAVVASSSPSRERPPPPLRGLPTAPHWAICDGCDWYTFTGERFRCTTCADYDLCQGCYDRNVHLDTKHTFKKIKTPGATPEYLDLRHAPTPHRSKFPEESLDSISAPVEGTEQSSLHSISKGAVVKQEDTMTTLPPMKKVWGLLGLLLRTSTGRAKIPVTSSRRPSEKIDLRPEDCVILVMGPTGAGKSTFISTAVGRNVGIEGALTSGTGTINSFRLPPAVKCSPLAILEDTRVVLVDTPGFDDTNNPDCQTFDAVAKWLENVSLNRLGIAGLIYLHRISDNRLSGTALKNLFMFGKLGSKIKTNVTFMTTMWSDISIEAGTRREAELEKEHFKEYIQFGATLARFEDDQNSVAKILEPIVAAWRSRQDEDRILSMVRLRKETTAYQFDTAERSAARVVRGKVQATLERRQELLDTVAARIEADKDDPEFITETIDEMTRLQAELDESQRDADRLKLEFATALNVFVAKTGCSPHPLIRLAQTRLVRPSESTPQGLKGLAYLESQDENGGVRGASLFPNEGANLQDAARSSHLTSMSPNEAIPILLPRTTTLDLASEGVAQRQPHRQQSTDSGGQKRSKPAKSPGKLTNWRPFGKT